MEAAVALFVFFAGGLAWLAWNHPKAYDTVSPFLIAISFGIAALIWGVNVGYANATDYFREFLTPAGLEAADKLMLRVNARASLWGLAAVVSALSLSFMGGLKFLPRGKD